MLKRLIPLLLLAGVVSLAMVACGGDGDEEATPTTRPAAPAPAAPTQPPAPAATVAPPPPSDGRSVRIVNEDVGGSGAYKFSPSELTFKLGETVNLILRAETEFHTFTVDDLGIDQDLGAGEELTVPFTFDKPGTFALICLVHPQMTGTITVQ